MKSALKAVAISQRMSSRGEKNNNNNNNNPYCDEKQRSSLRRSGSEACLRRTGSESCLCPTSEVAGLRRSGTEANVLDTAFNQPLSPPVVDPSPRTSHVDVTSSCSIQELTSIREGENSPQTPGMSRAGSQSPARRGQLALRGPRKQVPEAPSKASFSSA